MGDASPYRNIQNSDTGIDTIFNVSMHRVSQCIARIDEFT